MIRRFNFSQRKKIIPARLPVTLVPQEDGFYSFDIQLNLRGLNLMKEAKVFVEAYHQYSYMRFAFGEVGKLSIPKNRTLSEIDKGTLPMFRVKVVDTSSHLGKLLAVADKIVPIEPNAEPDNQVDLLPMEYLDIGEEIWQLDITGDRPVLVLNNKIPAMKDIVRCNPIFVSLVFPEVVRRIMTRIIIDDDITDPQYDEGDWPSLWLRFALKLPGIGAPPSGGGSIIWQEKKYWIETVVNSFCRNSNIRDNFIQSFTGKSTCNN